MCSWRFRTDIWGARSWFCISFGLVGAFVPRADETHVALLPAATTLCRKFVKKSILEDPARGLLLNDTIIIRYQIELVVSTGGALARQITNERPSKSVVVPPPNLGSHMLRLFDDRLHTDVVFEVESNQLAAHKIILSARSPVFKALLTGPMLEGASSIASLCPPTCQRPYPHTSQSLTPFPCPHVPGHPLQASKIWW